MSAKSRQEVLGQARERYQRRTCRQARSRLLDEVCALCGYELLEPGETRLVEFTLDQRAFSYWDVKSSTWSIAPGTFSILVGNSSRNLNNRAGIKIFQNSVSQIGFTKLDVDWPGFLARHDMIWDRLPRDYFEGAFVGNGLMGTILFQDDKQPNTLRFELGRTDVYDHRQDRGTWQCSTHGRVRLPIGQLLLTPLGEITQARLRTDLWNAEIRATLLTTKGSITLRCFVPSDSEVIVLTMASTGAEGGAVCSVRPQQGDSPRYTVEPNRDKGYVYQPNPPLRVHHIDGLEAVTQPLLAGSDYATVWSDTGDLDGARTVFVAIANRQGLRLNPPTGSAADALDALRAAQRRGVADLETAHRAWWHGFYPASFLSVPDARIESFYWIQLYKLASATRGDRPVVDLMGPWFKPSVWGAYWQNLNTQLNYYITNVTNHIEIGDALCRLLERHTGQLIANVPESLRPDCAGLGNPNGFDELIAPILQPVVGDPEQAPHFIALPWFMQQFYLQYRHTMDDARLRATIYPLLRRTFQVYLHTLIPGPDGRYHVPYAYSDEYGNAEDTSLNIALARWGFQTLIACAERLRIDDPLLPRWRDVLEKLVDYPVDPATGIMIGKDTPFARPHRHSSHLFAIFPFHVLTPESHPGQVPLMEQSVDHFIHINGNSARNPSGGQSQEELIRMDGDDCMFKFTGASSLWATLGNGDKALAMLERAVEILPRNRATIGPNTLYSEGGWPTFESPISAARNITDMLLQSWGGVIRVFPACPAAWKDAVFHDLRAEGAFLVSAARSGGQARFLRVKSLAGEPCRIKCAFSRPVKCLGPSTANLRQDGDRIDLDLRTNEEALLYGGDVPPDFVISPLPADPDRSNAWGIHCLNRKPQ